MTLPNYQRPFELSDLRGAFVLNEEHVRALDGSTVYHACHLEETRDALAAGHLSMRSECSFSFGEPADTFSTCCLWVGLNHFTHGNDYGPILFEMPIAVLEERVFLAFQRRDTLRNRYFFVEVIDEALIHLASTADVLDPLQYFERTGAAGAYQRKADDIYDIVVHEPLRVNDARIKATAHPHCISRKCSGLGWLDSRKLLQSLALEVFEAAITTEPFYRRLLERFPDLEGALTHLPELPPSTT